MKQDCTAASSSSCCGLGLRVSWARDSGFGIPMCTRQTRKVHAPPEELAGALGCSDICWGSRRSGEGLENDRGLVGGRKSGRSERDEEQTIGRL